MALLLLVAALLAGPLPAMAAPDAAGDAMAADQTLLRLAQLSPDLRDVEIVVSSVADSRSSVVVAELGYGEVSPYQMVTPGDYVVAVRRAGTNEPSMVGRTLSVRAGAAYTVAAVSAEADGMAVFDDDLTPPAPGRAQLRVINAAGPAEALDVRRTGGETLALGLPRGQAGPYAEVDPGTVPLTVAPPGGPETPLPVSVGPNQIASVVLTGDQGGPRATVVIDADGPAAVPPGPVHAGFGGAAGTGAPVRSAVLAVLAAVAAGVAIRFARAA